MSDVNKDVDGKTSAKRIWSGRLLGSGLLMSWIWFVVYIKFLWCGEVLSMDFPFEMFFGVMGAGMTGLGLVLGERYTKKS